jgi:DNA-binding PucR family transcriptional regulator
MRLSREHLLAALDPRYLALSQLRGHDVMIDTLEVYLECAGSVQRASARLSIERASLYYRLRRIEDLAGIDLNDGNQRLALHFSLKLARLLGLP